MKYPKTLSVRGHVICVDEKVYEPAEDTFLLVENLKVGQEDVVLDMGTGCGVLAVLVADKAKKVVATDINPYAIDCAKKNAKRNCAVFKKCLDDEVANNWVYDTVSKQEYLDCERNNHKGLAADCVADEIEAYKKGITVARGLLTDPKCAGEKKNLQDNINLWQKYTVKPPNC